MSNELSLARLAVGLGGTALAAMPALAQTAGVAQLRGC